MQKLATTLQTHDTQDVQAAPTLRKAARDWACDSIDAFDGTLLKKALGISGAIAEFLNELKDPEDNQ